MHRYDRYMPPRWGHAPDHLRGWLYQFVTGEHDEVDLPGLGLWRLTGILWKCTDILPSDVSRFIRRHFEEGDRVIFTHTPAA